MVLCMSVQNRTAFTDTNARPDELLASIDIDCMFLSFGTPNICISSAAVVALSGIESNVVKSISFGVSSLQETTRSCLTRGDNFRRLARSKTFILAMEVRSKMELNFSVSDLHLVLYSLALKEKGKNRIFICDVNNIEVAQNDGI